MIRKLHPTLLALLIISSATAQDTLDLIFDSSFNGNASHNDPHLQDFFISDYGGVKQFNDSIFVYYRNYTNWNSNESRSEVVAKTIRSNGSVSDESVYSIQEYYGQDPSDYYSITDVVVSNDMLTVISNKPFDDNGLTRYGIHLESYDFSNGSFQLSSSWGGLIQLSNTNIYNAKGAMNGNELVLVMNYSTSAREIAAITVSSSIGNITYDPAVVLTDNAANFMQSDLADILMVSATEIYIADNAYLPPSLNSNFFEDRARIIKYNPSSSTLSGDYTSNGAGFSEYLNWNSQTETPFPQNYIRKITHAGGKLLVAGYYREYDGSPYQWTRGRISRLNADGSLDDSFAANSSATGTFTNALEDAYSRWSYSDIDVKSDGRIFVSASGVLGNSLEQPASCFFIEIDNLGYLDQTIGNDGLLFENPLYGEVKETIILSGNSPSEDRFVFNGTKILNADPFNFIAEITTGRLVWNNAQDTIVDDTLTGLNEMIESSMNLYPNPSNSILNIELNEASPVFIMDVLGKTVLCTLLQSGKNSIDVSALKSGVYFFRAANGRAMKFVKE